MTVFDIGPFYFYRKLSMKRLDFLRQLVLGIGGIPVLSILFNSFNKKETNILLEHFYVAGYSYYDGGLIENKLKKGAALQMTREPDNPHDKKAISLWLGETMIGYVPKHKNTTLTKLMDQGVEMTTIIKEFDPGAHVWNMLFVEVKTDKFA